MIAGFLADVGVVFDSAPLAAACPKRDSLRSCFVDNAVDSTLCLRTQFSSAVAVFISRDKGNRKGIGHFPKVLSWWCAKEKKVISVCIDADGSGGTSKECADAILHSLKKFGGVLSALAGQTTDGGGGGVLHHLKEALSIVHLVDHNLCFVAPCSLHGTNIVFANAVKAVFGEGKLKARNTM